MGDEIKQRLLSVEQAARFLNIPPSAIYKGIAKKSKKPFPVPVKRLGRRVRFDIRDLEKFVDQL